MTTLYLTEQYASVRVDDETLVVNIPANREMARQASKVRVPLNKVSHVVVMGNITLTTPVFHELSARGVEVNFLTPYGTFIGRLWGKEHKHAQHRMLQCRAHDDPTTALYLSRVTVRAKLQNQRAQLKRSNRGRQDEDLTAAIRQLDHCVTELDALPHEDHAPENPSRPQAGTVMGSLMGLEGSGAAAYFRGLTCLLDDDWGFRGRRKRPPTDPINALLSYGYTLLSSHTMAAIAIVGLDPYIGYLHGIRHGKPALALDIMEMFRTPIVDSVVLTLANTGAIRLSDFTETLGAWRLNDRGRRVFLERFAERLNTEIQHPVFKYRTSYQRSLELQARLLSRWLQGEFKRYRGFTIR